MSRAIKPPAKQGGPVDDRAGTALESLLEKALSEARAETSRREEVEQKLERLRIEAASLAIALNQAERDLKEARNEVTPKTAERIAELDAALVKARSELVREKASREQLERDYDAAALQSGAQLKQLRADAEQARAEADRAQTVAEEARTGLKKAQEQRNRDREQLAALEQLLEAATKQKAEPQAAKPALSKPARVQPPTAPPPQPLVDESPGAPIAQQGRLKRRKRMFEARGRTCAVCRLTETASPGALNAAGWALGAEIDLCPECQGKGWQLPKAGSLPFRRSSQRGEAG